MDLSSLLKNLQLNNTNNANNKILQSVNSLPNLNLDESLSAFLDGEVLKGEVVDINGLVAKILTPKGEINGHLQNIGQLNIGDEREFLIKNENGLIKFGIVKGDESLVQDNNLKKQLSAQGLKTTPQDIEIAKNLMKNELPVNKETLNILSRAMSMLSKDEKSLEKALFLLKNEIPVNKENAKILDNLVNKTINTLENSNQIEQNINNIKDTAVKEQLLNILKDVVPKNPMADNNNTQNTQNTQNPEKNIQNQPNQNVVANDEVLENATKDIPKEVTKEATLEQQKNIFDNIKKEDLSSILREQEGNIKMSKDEVKDIFKFTPKNMDIKELDEFLSKSHDKLEKAIEILKNADPKNADPATQKLLEQLNNQKEGMDFMKFMKNNVYMQIPININNNKTNGELLVFKDKNKKNKGKNGVSAIIGLDTVNLGRFETYVQKLDNKVNLQFRLENDDVIELTKKHLGKLQTLLQNHNLQIDSVTYKTINKSFTVLSTENEINEEIQNDFTLPHSVNVKV